MRERVRTPESARSVTNAVRTHFGRFRIDGRLYQGKASDDLSPDPVRMHNPLPSWSSTARRTRFHSSGVSCHSSNTIGVGMVNS